MEVVPKNICTNARVMELRNNKGITLLELIVVITILGILSYMAMPIYHNTTSSMKGINTKNQVSAVLDIASSTARAKLTKTKVIFYNDKISIILLEQNGVSWEYKNTIDTVYLEQKVTIPVETEVIYGVDGFPEEEKSIDINTPNTGNIVLTIYTDGRFVLQ